MQLMGKNNHCALKNELRPEANTTMTTILSTENLVQSGIGKAASGQAKL